METEPIIRTQQLSRVVAGKTLVDSISVQVRQGDFVAIAGPSGAGKSSFLRLLNRLDEPTSGTVYLHGQDYRTLAPRDLRRRVGMVMQAPCLFPGSVADNIRFGPLQRGENVPDERIIMLLERVGLAGYEKRDIQYLSGGEAQRVSVARTLANSPEVLLLDEPTSALDRAAEWDVEQLLLSIIESDDLTCLMVTHDMAQAERIAQTAILLEDGRVVKQGPVAEVIHA